MDYDFREIEAKWQREWERMGLFRAPPIPGERKFYLLEMFAYPSGDIHMGHYRNYSLGDSVARVKLMQGYDLLHPFGWDAFGLPAENAAIARGLHPRDWTRRNIEVSRATLQRTGVGYDWAREVSTCEPGYYRWTQWLFLLLYRRGLAYRSRAAVNWCPSCATVLANEQVKAGVCERCHTDVTRRELTQWFFRITAYADRLLSDLELLRDWPENIRAMQSYWIGRSRGAELDFEIPCLGEKLPVFTTRPDTIYGATFLALAPESALIERLVAGRPEEGAVREFAATARDRVRGGEEAQEGKGGVFTGRHARHPFSGADVPLWVADYVMAGYGTGAIMGVPAHDQRDFEFARAHGIAIRPVIFTPETAPDLRGEEMETAFVGEGSMRHSGSFDGMPSGEGGEAVTAEAARGGFGRGKINYRLRDWLISRQRYWGAPIPMIHCAQCGMVPVPEEDLPVLLPEEIRDFMPQGRSPLADAESFIRCRCPACGGEAERDPDTMDTFVCSSWYYLRYLDASGADAAFDRAQGARWLPVDQYIGGTEHATGHLLYFRFIHKVLMDEGLVDSAEPASALFNHGMVLDAEGQVMSKSKGNVVSPTELLDEHGTDALRLAMLFAAPPDREINWTGEGLPGAVRFIRRVHRLVRENEARLRRLSEQKSGELERRTPEEERLYRSLQRMLARVARDLDSFRHNTAISSLMEFLHDLTGWRDPDSPVYLHSVREFIRALAPVAPHLGEELWHMAGGEGTVFRSGWLSWDPAALAQGTASVVVQVNGRLRAQLALPRGSSKEDIQAAALREERVSRAVGERRIERVVVVPDRLINLVLAKD